MKSFLDVIFAYSFLYIQRKFHTLQVECSLQNALALSKEFKFHMSDGTFVYSVKATLFNSKLLLSPKLFFNSVEFLIKRTQ